MLDIIRVFASAVVAYGHLTQSYFSSGWTDQTNLARDAVAVFFVLSGFVIRHVTCRNQTSFKHYLGDRASRIYSIAVPALGLTLLTDSIARYVNPGYYAFWSASYVHPLLRIFTNLIFCGQLWNHFSDPLSNNPYWSINYEVAYYLLYGCAFYLAGNKRWFWIAVFGLLFGPRVLYLAPLWIAGCIAHDLYQKWNAKGTTDVNLNYIFLGMLACFLVLPLPYIHAVLHNIHYRSDSQIVVLLKGKRLTVVNYVFGIVWIVVFMRLLLIARRITIQSNTVLVRSIRFISEGTYPIYLLHYPFYVLIAACIPYNHAHPLPKIIIYLSVLTLGVLAGHPGNILKNKIRALFPYSKERTRTIEP